MERQTPTQTPRRRGQTWCAMCVWVECVPRDLWPRKGKLRMHKENAWDDVDADVCEINIWWMWSNQSSMAASVQDNATQSECRRCCVSIETCLGARSIAQTLLLLLLPTIWMAAACAVAGAMRTSIFSSEFGIAPPRTYNTMSLWATTVQCTLYTHSDDILWHVHLLLCSCSLLQASLKWEIASKIQQMNRGMLYAHSTHRTERD